MSIFLIVLTSNIVRNLSLNQSFDLTKDSFLQG